MGRYSGRSSRLIFMCFVSLVLFAVEISVAYVGNSLSLASDAFAVLSHLISMIIGLLGVRFSRIRWHKANTFGFSRADVLGAFGNSVFAVALMFSIFIEAIKRYINPQKTEKALLVLIVGIAGLFFNVFNYVIFMDCCYCRGGRGELRVLCCLNTLSACLQKCQTANSPSSSVKNLQEVLLSSCRYSLSVCFPDDRFFKFQILA
uniref:Cation efflux protein transmembrane domain-containing protein n=1 Tax=Anas zonorhyncha TaxID=75864 RepID=A0A8B9U5M0_9AVES